MFERGSDQLPRTWRGPTGGVFAVVLLLAAAAAPAGANHSPLTRPHARFPRGCPGAERNVAQAATQAMRGAVLCLINEQRTSRGLPALRELRPLDRSAQAWTDAMIRAGSFSHVGGSSDPGERARAAGYAWSSIGENIATGYPTPRQVVSAWMASSGHCRNILAPDFTDVGTGISSRPVGSFASGPATWTQDFGLRAGRSAPSRNWRPARDCPR